MFSGRLKKITSLKIVNVEIYQKAFTHRSSNLKDDNGNSINFERLEFLGDSMLSIVISALLFQSFPEAKEGTLTKYRAKIVSRENLNNIGKKLGLIEFIDGEIKANLGNNIHGNLLEALVGAIFIDRGYVKCKEFILKKIVSDYVDLDQLKHTILSYKGLLLEWGQKNKKIVQFKTDRDKGLDPKFNYTTSVYLNNRLIVKAREISKKKSEEKSARRAYHAMNIKYKI
jgi:ribonuclease-3